MAVILPVKGSLNWDISLNAALTYLDNNTTAAISTSLQAANNLSDLTNVPAARSNLGISAGSVAGVNNYNVKDYGALGNGVADDTTAIQNAINAATNGGTVYFPPGSYLLNGSSSLNVSVAGVALVGAGSENSKIIIGASFSAAQAINVTNYNFQFRDLSLSGSNSTLTSNPVANGIEITASRRAKIQRSFFSNINGWAIEGLSTSSSSTSNFFGSLISDNYFNSCAGGIHTLGNTTQGYAVNTQISDNQMYVMGATTGASANLDCIKIEDSWDLLVTNNICWISVGTGASLHVKGNCAATFVKNYDGLGPSTGNCVLIEDSTNGSPQNVQIDGGVIQQGNIGMRVTGGATNVHVGTVRFINNQTHGASIEGTGTPIHFNNTFFTQSGAVGSGTNYDINWSGSSAGYIVGCRFATTIGAPGVTDTLNFPASAPVRVLNCSFNGTGSTSANWYTNQPLGFMEASAGQFNFASTPKFTNGTALTAMGTLAVQPATSGTTILSANVNASDAFDRMRITGAGDITIGSGTAARDVTLTRAAANVLGLTATDLQITTAGRGVKIAEGTNAKMGTATANGTTGVTVSTTAVTANSRIFLTGQNQGGTAGFYRVGTITAGTSFTIISSNAADTSTVAWLIVDHT